MCCFPKNIPEECFYSPFYSNLNRLFSGVGPMMVSNVKLLHVFLQNDLRFHLHSIMFVQIMYCVIIFRILCFLFMMQNLHFF